jgi:hypothetical protein
MWKEVAMGYLEVLSRHLRVEADDNGNPKNSRSPRQDSNSMPPKYEVAMLHTQPRRSYDACLTNLIIT